ncbi:YraN family protein [Nostoc sp. TCL26-01]|uniref:YraN family protein n=1 Tax=Nostoc sp. TCL26-01 TaxID=2576904 RepID=UPI0015C196CC|nr:YraN family protein [Nostoc sp. TCL26-01]QLE55400.1 YraN family protein [Nostoc sp. TCL26-01]
MANPPPSHYPDIGDLGEDLVAQWLQSTGWIILHRRFGCRWGEIDIIAQSSEPILAFVEVKTRSPGSWDDGGRNAITQIKQAKIGKTAGIFLAKYPKKAEYPCRFDVAIVSCQIISQQSQKLSAIQKPMASSSVAGYQLHLQEYIPAAFDWAME